MITFLLFAALLSAPLPGPKSPGQGTDVKAIKALHARLLAAFKAKDAKAIKPLFASGFTETANGYTFNRDQALAQMTQGLAAAGSVVWTMSGLDVHGDKAAYTSNFAFEISRPGSAGAPGSEGKTHRMTGTGIQKVQLAKEGGKWLYSHVEVLSAKMAVDVKPFNTQAQPATK